jgi:predicted transcriptional regulator
MTRYPSQDGLRVAIKLYAQNLGVSQVELADSANVSQPLISRFVAGTANLSENSMERVRKALLELIRDRATAVGFFPAVPSGLSDGQAPSQTSLQHVSA